MPPPNSPQFSSDPDGGAIADLRAAIAGLEAQVTSLSERVAQLETGRPAAIPSELLKPAASAKPGLESRLGLTIVNRVGAITLAIGIIFFFKYAVDSRWIGAEARVIIGLVAGFAMLGAAEWLHHGGGRLSSSDQGVFLQGIAGCGVATVYVALYASFAYYDLIIPVAGFLFLVLASALAVLLALRYNSPAIAALGFVGGLLAPLLLHFKAPQVWLDAPFIFLLSLTATYLAARRDWPMLLPIVGSLAILTAAILFGVKEPGWFIAPSLLMALAYFTAARQRGQDAKLATFAYVMGHVSLVLALLRGAGIWSAYSAAPTDRGSLTNELVSVVLSLYGAGLLVAGMRGRRILDRTLGLMLLGIVILKLYLWDVWQVGRFYRISAFVALGVLLLGASFVYSRFRAHSGDRS